MGWNMRRWAFAVVLRLGGDGNGRNGLGWGGFGVGVFVLQSGCYRTTPLGDGADGEVGSTVDKRSLRRRV